MLRTIACRLASYKYPLSPLYMPESVVLERLRLRISGVLWMSVTYQSDAASPINLENLSCEYTGHRALKINSSCYIFWGSSLFKGIC